MFRKQCALHISFIEYCITKRGRYISWKENDDNLVPVVIFRHPNIVDTIMNFKLPLLLWKPGFVEDENRRPSFVPKPLSGEEEYNKAMSRLSVMRQVRFHEN